MRINRTLTAWVCGTVASVGLILALGSCDSGEEHAHDEHGEHSAEELERGPHGGRILRDGNVAMEITIFETNAPPEFRVYPTVDNKPVDPKQVQISM